MNFCCYPPDLLAIPGDLRPTHTRAKELVARISKDKIKPDIICFQEVFHEDANKTLCLGLKQHYPYIADSIAPLIIYNIHTQALIGDARSTAREKQLKDLLSLVDKDHQANPGAHQIIMGDFNISRVNRNMWPLIEMH